ncbi:MAG: hypothetical protein RML46_06560 [Anaerolineae bacterium]|nr:hypothetical protein [Anaerolineae bacterium]
MQVMDFEVIKVPYGYRVWFLKLSRLRGVLFDSLEETRRVIVSQLRQQGLSPVERGRLERLHRSYLSALYEPTLHAVIDGAPWQTSQWNQAICRSCRRSLARQDDCPFEDSPLGHAWGFYAFHDLLDALEYMVVQATQKAVPGWVSDRLGVDPMFMVIGISLHAGRIWEGTKGLRSTQAYAYALLGPDEESIYALKLPEDFQSYYPSLREIPWRWPEVLVLPAPGMAEVFHERVKEIRAVMERYVPIHVGMPGIAPGR